jgi:Ca-activated chloride channel family protein
VRLGIEVTLDPAGLPLSRVRSALHAAWADEDQGRLRVKVGAGERLDRDFILRFCLADDRLRSTARLTRRDDGDDAFLLTVLPPQLSTTTTRPREIVFLLDRSGSMGGWKMVAARRAVARMVDTLRAGDRFCVLAFDNHVDAVPDLGARLVDATDRNRFRAVEWLAKIEARGGTEMAQPLSQGADLLAQGFLQSDRVLVFVTDGQVGNEAQLMKLLGNRLGGARVFALGIDKAVNAGFMNRLAALGGQGEAELVESEDRVDEVLTRCHRRIDTPVLADLQVVVDNATLTPETLAPTRLPDVFAGVPAVIAGRVRRHRGGGKPTVTVRGRRADGSWHEERVPLEPTANAALVPAWARLHLRDLEDQFDGNRGDKRALERRIVQVSLDARVLCRFTAFVAVDHEVVNEGGRLARVVQSVETPAGWTNERAEHAAAFAGAPMPMPARPAPAAARGNGPPPPSAPMPAMAKRAPAPAPTDSFDDADIDADLYAAAPSMSVAAPARPAPPPPPTRAPAKGVLDSLADAVGGVARRLRSDAEPAPATPAVSPGAAKESATALAPWLDAIRQLLGRLDRGEALEDVADDLRLLLEEIALGGVPPTTRQPLQQALVALEAGDRDKARERLRAVVGDAPSGAGGFWR